MKKWIAILLASVLTFCMLAGCQSTGTEEFTLEKGHKIKDAIWNHFGRDPGMFICMEPWEIEYSTGMPYLGFVNGYDFFHCGGFTPLFRPEEGGDNSVDLPPDTVIAGYVFSGTVDEGLMAHKEGKIYLISDLYGSGKISEKVVSQIQKEYDDWRNRVNNLTNEERDNETRRLIAELKESGSKYTGGWEPPEGD